jgi:hypothetical protein
MKHQDDYPSPESIARAKDAQSSERRAFERESGLKLDADGQVITKKPDVDASGSTDTFVR